MATPDKVSFSGQHRSLEDVALYYLDARAAFIDFFAGSSPELQLRYAGAKLDVVRDIALKELDLTSCLSVLTTVEAAVRIDYLSRVYARKKDQLSLAMREIYKGRENAAKLEDDLLRAWRDSGVVGRNLIGELIGAFKYRHWLAHGRYWSPKFGRIYDYVTVYGLAEEFLEAMEQY
ncbi:hypothetical protein [Alcaligenes faecalis]|uniref:Uncharacterized protein n=1 Tax=Alcaligenes faecalis TaxID=511 RepID=A0A2U2BGD8_ALCFA|nr:hypothetical protein [Alcaligenes faecalis]PWE13037.1 hypothetical protein DF183_14475 [Alcaligenes faecalis]